MFIQSKNIISVQIIVQVVDTKSDDTGGISRVLQSLETRTLDTIRKRIIVRVRIFIVQHPTKKYCLWTSHFRGCFLVFLFSHYSSHGDENHEGHNGISR